MKTLFVSSYVPRKCGIATYTRDLTNALRNQKNDVTIAAIENDISPVTLTNIITYKIRQNEKKDYLSIARAINDSDIDIVHIQHEFGLFGGLDGEYILELTRSVKKILIITFHTVLSTPSDHKKRIMQELAGLSSKIIVMEEIAKDRLETIYGFNARDIQVILHGVPDIKDIQKKEAKKELLYDNSFLLLSSNLISRNKGFEYAIGAVAKVVKKIPNIIFLIVGETHPVIKIKEGESYREELVALTKKLNIEKHVIFINEYVSIDTLRTFLAAADICLTPYLDAQQITSGTLSYAIGAGKACISTDYIYAKNMLADGKGILVPFRSKNAIAKAILDLFTNRKKAANIEKKAYTLGEKMRWPYIAQQHYTLYKTIFFFHNSISQKTKVTIKQIPDLSYLENLSDDVGVLQHAHYNIPEGRFGYSTDDNARAFLAISLLYKKNKSEKLLNLLRTYISYLRLAQEPSGRFHTFLNFHHEWVDQEDNADPYGKTLWALGIHLCYCKNSPLSPAVLSIFNISLRQIDSIRDLRTAAYAILGLYYYSKAFKGKKEGVEIAKKQIQYLADFIVSAFEKNSSPKWQWFEDAVTYDNFRLPQALFAAYLLTKKEQYKKVAKKTLSFLSSCNFDDERGYFDFVGQNGWYQQGNKKAVFDQQPLEAAAAVEAYLFANYVSAREQYLEKAYLAFEWFYGKNKNNRSLYDEKTGGIFDGLTPTGVNMNEGAESLVCYLIAGFMLSEQMAKKT